MKLGTNASWTADGTSQIIAQALTNDAVGLINANDSGALKLSGMLDIAASSQDGAAFGMSLKKSDSFEAPVYIAAASSNGKARGVDIGNLATDVKFKDSLNVVVEGKAAPDATGTDIASTATAALFADSGTITADRGGYISSTQYALFSYLGGTININSGAEPGEDLHLTGNARAFMSYPSTPADISTINIELGQGSQWKGAAVEKTLNTPSSYDGEINLKLKDGGTCFVTGDSTLTSLDSDDGIIDLSYAPDGTAVDIDKLTRTGGTEVFTDDPLGSRITVTDHTGYSAVSVHTDGKTNDSYSNADLLQKDLVAVVTGADGNSLVSSVQAAEGDLYGALDAAVDADGNWVVSRSENQKISDFVDAASLSVLSWRQQLDYMHSRMGELRDMPAVLGVWARVYGSEYEYAGNGAESDACTVQIGADKALGRWLVGGALSYTDGSYDLRNGDGNHYSYSAGIYGTYITQTGSYLDLSTKVYHLSSDFNIGPMAGSWTNYAVSLTAEAGHKYILNDYFFAEPQAALAYGYMWGDDADTSNGLKINQDDFQSLIARAGGRVGAGLMDNKLSLYLKASVLHEFLGDLDTKFTLLRTGSSETYSEDFDDTWFEYGADVSAALGQLQLFAEGSRSASAELEQNWRFNVGVRFTF